MTDSDNPDQSELGFKLRRVGWQVPVLALVLIAVYSPLNWLLVARSGFLQLDSDVANFWLPGAIAVLLVVAFVHRGIRLLDLTAFTNLPTIYYLAAVVAIGAPALIAQAYVSEAAGTLTNVADASAIVSAPETKFYAARTPACLARAGTQAQEVTSLSGRHDTELNFDLYVAIPVCGMAVDRAVWIGLNFHQQISNSQSDADKEAAYRAFAQDTESKINALDPSAYRFYERAGHSAERRNFEKALERGGIAARQAIILIPHREAFDQRTGDTASWLLAVFAMTNLVWLIMVLAAPVDLHQSQDPIEQRTAGRGPDGGNLNWLKAFLLPRPENYGLPLLIDVNLAVFLAMVFAGLGVVSFQTDDLLAWGAAYRPAIKGLGVFRLISSQFVHGGLMHIAGNMYGLVITGMFLGPVLKNLRLILCYLACGLVGAVASVAYHPHTVSVGASGAIFGLAGILLVLTTFNDRRVREVRTPLLINIGIFVAYNLVLGFANSGIDNAAHIGGLAAGLTLGLLLLATGSREPDLA